MQPARIADLLAPFLPARPLSPLQLEQVSNHLDLLLQWNARINLTSVRSPEDIIARHFGESFFLAQTLFPSGKASAITPQSPVPGPVASDPRSPVAPPLSHAFRDRVGTSAQTPPQSACDLGSGAGFPGLPLKIWQPALSLTLIESNAKKATFLKEVIRKNTLTEINVFSGRAEDLAITADLVTMRAVDRFERSLPLATHLLNATGTLALLIGASQVSAANSLGSIHWRTPLPLPLSNSRLLLLGAKRAD